MVKITTTLAICASSSSSSPSYCQAILPAELTHSNIAISGRRGRPRLDAGGARRIFYVNFNQNKLMVTLLLSNLELANGWADPSKVDKFDKQKARLGMGGAMFIDNWNPAEVNLIDCLFAHNRAARGGVVATYPSLESAYTAARFPLNVYGGSFVNNSASVTGGILFFEQPKRHDIRLEAVTLEKNVIPNVSASLCICVYACVDSRSQTILGGHLGRRGKRE